MAIERNMEDVVAAPYGTYTINDTDIVTGIWDVLQVDTATVFTAIYINGDYTNNVASQYLSNPSGTVQPTLICALPGHTFNRLQLASGQVTAVIARQQ